MYFSTGHVIVDRSIGADYFNRVNYRNIVIYKLSNSLCCLQFSFQICIGLVTHLPFIQHPKFSVYRKFMVFTLIELPEFNCDICPRILKFRFAVNLF